MDTTETINALAALAQPTRLSIFRMLVAAAPDGVPAGEIARAHDVPHNTASAHLAILTRAGLLAASREGRVIRYAANLDAVRSLVVFLLKDCCQGRSELCAPILESIAPCCPPKAGTVCQ